MDYCLQVCVNFSEFVVTKPQHHKMGEENRKTSVFGID